MSTIRVLYENKKKKRRKKKRETKGEEETKKGTRYVNNMNDL